MLLIEVLRAFARTDALPKWIGIVEGQARQAGTTQVMIPVSVRVSVPQDVRPFQPVGQHQRFVAEQFAGRSIRHHRAAVQHDRARAQLHHQFQVVRRDQLWSPGSAAAAP